MNNFCCLHLEPKDWITLFSVLIIITGWFVNGYLNRKNEIAKKRLDYRLPALLSFFKVWSVITKNGKPFSDPTFLPLIEEARSSISMYGDEDEIILYEKFIRSIEKSELENANKALEELVPLMRSRIRKELNIKTTKSFERKNNWTSL